MSEEEAEVGFMHHGIGEGPSSIFQGFAHCETDRFWRRSLGLSNEKYLKGDSAYTFDECNNAFMKPKLPIKLTLLANLHKFADYQ
jgi:hypothetical protein